MRAARNCVNERPPGMGAPRSGLLVFFIAGKALAEKLYGCLASPATPAAMTKRTGAATGINPPRRPRR